MPTNQPSNSDDVPAEPREEATAASVLADEQLDDPAGGGGLGGAAAADPLAGSGRGAGGPAPNAPFDPAVPHDGGEAKAEREAQRRSLADSGDEDPPSSQ